MFVGAQFFDEGRFHQLAQQQRIDEGRQVVAIAGQIVQRACVAAVADRSDRGQGSVQLAQALAVDRRLRDSRVQLAVQLPGHALHLSFADIADRQCQYMKVRQPARAVLAQVIYRQVAQHREFFPWQPPVGEQ